MAEESAVFMAQESKLTQKEKMLAQKEQKLASTKMKDAGSAIDLFPPNAKPGECYARVFRPSKYVYKSEAVLVHDAKESIRIIPAQYKTVEETVLVKEAR